MAPHRGAQGRRFDARSLADVCRRRSLRPQRSAPANLPNGICLTELGVSGQRRLSVGGAITHFRHRLLRKAAGTRKAARGYAATVGFRRANRRRRSNRPKRSAPARTRSGKSLRDRCDDRVIWKSPDVPEFLPSPSVARCTRIPIQDFFSLLQHPRRGEVATKDF